MYITIYLYIHIATPFNRCRPDLSTTAIEREGWREAAMEGERESKRGRET